MTLCSIKIPWGGRASFSLCLTLVRQSLNPSDEDNTLWTMHERKLTAITRILRKDMHCRCMQDSFFPNENHQKLNYSRYVNLFHIYLSYIARWLFMFFVMYYFLAMFTVDVIVLRSSTSYEGHTRRVSFFRDNARIKHYILYLFATIKKPLVNNWKNSYVCLTLLHELWITNYTLRHN